MLFDLRQADVGDQCGLHLFAEVVLQFAKVDGIDDFAGKATEVVEELALWTAYGFAAVKLCSFSLDFVLGSDNVLHVSDLAIDCELIDVNLIVRVEKLEFGHVFDDFP